MDRVNVGRFTQHRLKCRRSPATTPLTQRSHRCFAGAVFQTDLQLHIHSSHLTYKIPEDPWDWYWFALYYMLGLLCARWALPSVAFLPIYLQICLWCKHGATLGT